MRLCICASAGYILVINRPLGSIVKQQEPRPSGFALGPRCLLAIERSERDTLRSVQLRNADIYIVLAIRAIFVLITRKVGGA